MLAGWSRPFGVVKVVLRDFVIIYAYWQFSMTVRLRYFVLIIVTRRISLRSSLQTTRRAYHREIFIPPWSVEARQQSQDLRGAGSAFVNAVFAEATMVSDDTCLIVKNWTFLSSRHWRRHRFRRFRSSGTIRRGDASAIGNGRTKARRRSSAPLRMHGSIHQRGTVVSSSGILYRCSPHPAPSSRGCGPFLSSFSVLHPSFLLSLNSRRATARAFPVTFSLVNLQNPSPSSPFLLLHGLLPSLLRTLLRSASSISETASGHSVLSLLFAWKY